MPEVPGSYVRGIPAPVRSLEDRAGAGYLSDGKKVFSRIGMSFAMIYAAIIMVDYFVQLAVVVPSLQSGETAGLSLFTQYNPHGIFITFEALGYPMMSVAFLFAAPVFAGGRV